MKKLVLAFGILASVVSVSMGALSKEQELELAIISSFNQRGQNTIGELERVLPAIGNCFNQQDKNACEVLINSGAKSVEQCDKNTCRFIGVAYFFTGRYREAIPYFEKAIALGDDGGYVMLAGLYENLQDHYNKKKYLEVGCNKGNGDFLKATLCYNLGLMYYKGQGVRQDYAKAAELSKKACDMKYGVACDNLGYLYYTGQGVKQNLSTAKQYYGRACDLGSQKGCNNYKMLNEQGVR